MIIRKRPVTAQRIAYWKAADFLGSGAAVFKKGFRYQVGFWTINDLMRREFHLMGEGDSWDEALTQAKAAARELGKREHA